MRRHQLAILLPIIILFNGCTVNYEASVIAEGERLELVEKALSYIGVPYFYGGSDRNGLDCSGLIVSSFDTDAWYLGDDVFSDDANANDIYEFNTVSIDRPSVGDLAFWSDENGRVYHVAIIIDAEYMQVIDAYSVSGFVGIRIPTIEISYFGRLIKNESI